MSILPMMSGAVIDICFNFQPGKSGKARLISKMAKMGQPILPMMGGAVIAGEDESGEEEEEEGSIVSCL
jgi:hypothetical protein